MVPRLAPRQLPDHSARIAANCDLTPGELRPIRMSQEAYSPASASSILSMFKADETTWFAWPLANVTMARAQIEGAARFAYTGDGVPKMTTLALGLPVSPAGSPAAARTLGIPAPATAPGLSHSGGTGAAVTRFYCYTFVTTDWQEESAPSPVSAQITGKVDGTWAISAMDATPPNSASITGATYAAGVVTVTMSGNTFLRANDKITIASVVGMTDLNGVWSVLGTPAPNQFTVALTTAQTYTSGGTWTRVNAWGACTKRLYRTDGLKSDFQLVAEGITGATYSDTALAVNIPGDSLISQNWTPPPTNMIGLVSMSNGLMAGFYDNMVCFCEPYQPHAWPEAYRFKMADTVIGIAAFDTNLVVATKGVPVVLSGYDPSQMTVTRHIKPFPCLSRASVASVGDAVAYSTKAGMVRVNLSGAEIFTGPLFSPADWNALEPSTMRCAFDGGRLFICSNPDRRIYILNLQDGGAMSIAYQGIDAAFIDQWSGYFYFSAGGHIYEFDSFDGMPLVQDWWSKEYVLSTPGNLGAAKVEYDEEYSAAAQIALDAYRASIIAANQAAMASVGGSGGIGRRVINEAELNGSDLLAIPSPTLQLTFSLYAGGQLRFTREITDQECFRLPKGYRSDTLSVRVQANTHVRAISLADTPAGLANV